MYLENNESEQEVRILFLPVRSFHIAKYTLQQMGKYFISNITILMRLISYTVSWFSCVCEKLILNWLHVCHVCGEREILFSNFQYRIKFNPFKSDGYNPWRIAYET
jgi:hypothetical protein